jgi:hypothetical protein
MRRLIPTLQFGWKICTNFFFFATEKHDCRNGHAHLFCLHIPASFAIWDYFLIFSASTIAQRLYILAIYKDADGLFFPFN